MFLSKLFSKKTPQRKEKVEYITGKLSPIDAVFLSDLEKYPIWVFNRCRRRALRCLYSSQSERE